MKTEPTNKKIITVANIVNMPIETIWELWTMPKHIEKWNNASDDWHTPHAENDLKVGGRFLSRMEARDGSFGFDFGGIYDAVETNQLISYTMDDGRKATIIFTDQNNKTKVVETFEAEDMHSIDMQREGWQAILDHFKTYAESLNDV